MSAGLPDPMSALFWRYRRDEIFGASALAKEVAAALVQVADQNCRESREEIQRRLAQCANAVLDEIYGVAPVTNALHAVLSVLDAEADQSADALVEAMAHAAGLFRARVDQSIEQASENAVRLISNGDVIFAFTAGITVIRTLTLARQSGKEFRVILTGPDPFSLRRVVPQLAEQGVPIMVSTDLAMAIVMKEASSVMIGADAVAANGSILSRVGTFPAALVARECHVPFHVIVDTTKLDTASLLGIPFRIRPRRRSTLKENLGDLAAEVQDPGYELTPPGLLTSIITEFGAIAPEASGTLMERLPRSRIVNSHLRRGTASPSASNLDSAREDQEESHETAG